jgi:tRNA pseudouridine38-40 synthase
MRFATALLVAYDGSRGWAWEPTIRSTVVETLGRILRDPSLSIEAASRTDAGVHATGQTACVFSAAPPLGGDVQLLRYRANQLLPDDVVIRDICSVPVDFDVRANAGKIYRYHLNVAPVRDPLRRRVEWHCPPRHSGPAFSAERARVAAAHALGRHAFAPLANVQPAEPEREPHCTIRRIDVVDAGDGRVHIEVEGDRFLYRMVRNLAGLLARCGSGELEPALVRQILASGEWPSGVAKLTAPPHGLVLREVLHHPGRDPFERRAEDCAHSD